MRTLGAYVHVPFCATRCGYCDFNTYTAQELQRDGTTVSTATYVDRVISEVTRQRTALGNNSQPLTSVFFGGGTPTLLGSTELVRALTSLKKEFGLLANAEITTEVNPDSVNAHDLEILREGGFTRVSFGHQSSAPKVLQLLERTHTPGRTWEAVNWANEAGFEHISVDLIYGSPNETQAELELTLSEVIAADIDHVSAYSLIVEPGTKLAAQVARGEVNAPSDDVAASRYELIDQQLSSAGFEWYEVSNWAKPGGECKHNLNYWHNQDWIGIGPGAHAHINGLRTWMIKHPAAWAAQVDQNEEPIDGSEVLSATEIANENIMLGLRLRDGIELATLSPAGIDQANEAVTQGLLYSDLFTLGRVVLTPKGRLLADGLVSRLWN
jgi:putative oxygen-independent coproporphyrinogen III oxidase